MPTPTSEVGLDSYDENGRMHSPFIERGTGEDQTPRAVKLPDMAELATQDGNPTAAIYDVIARMNGAAYLQQFEVDQAQYLARFGYTPEDRRYRGTLDEVFNKLSGRELLGLARDLERTYATTAAFGGDLSQDAVWITEGDDSVCESCEAAADEVNATGGLRYDRWPSYPGASTCLGGSMCRCQAVIVESAPPAGGWLVTARDAQQFWGPTAPQPANLQWAYDAIDEWIDDL